MVSYTNETLPTRQQLREWFACGVLSVVELDALHEAARKGAEDSARLAHLDMRFVQVASEDGPSGEEDAKLVYAVRKLSGDGTEPSAWPDTWYDSMREAIDADIERVRLKRSGRRDGDANG